VPASRKTVTAMAGGEGGKAEPGSESEGDNKQSCQRATNWGHRARHENSFECAGD